MSIIEAGGRGGAVALLLLLAALLLRDGRRVVAARYGALFSLGVAASLVSWAPGLAMDRALWILPLRTLAFGNSAVFWVFATALFDDEFAPSWRHACAWSALVALGFWGLYGGGARPFLLLNGLALLCIFLALGNVLAGRAVDLVEARRRLRVGFVVSVGLFTTAILLTVILLRGGQGYPLLGLADAFGSLALTFFFATTLLSITREGTLLPLAEAGRSLAAVPRASDAPLAPPADERETALLAALRRQMEEERAYREEALSIAALAGKLGIPEYRLRRLINQRLGQRNFSAFLNGYRLAEAMAALADASQAEVPILTIALDAGFQSIGPFNRAFKTRTGMTPSEFRRQHLAGAGKAGAQALADPEIG
ncbi:MAG: helix-turn-helix domain-containing protein [Stellaceae bacterium]